MRRHGAIEATLDRARSFGARARAALASLPPPLQSGPATRALDEVVGFCISRAA
jgi:octaprenyl-diphosphate synthase